MATWQEAFLDWMAGTYTSVMLLKNIIINPFSFPAFFISQAKGDASIT